MGADTDATHFKNILIVEDDESIQKTLKMALEFRGYEVYTASNGKEGLDILPKLARPCLILLDLMMPVMDGWEFVEALTNDVWLTTIPVVVVSAYCDDSKPIRAKEIIKKPVDLDLLFAVVERNCPSSGRK